MSLTMLKGASSSPAVRIRYTSEALRNDVGRLQKAWGAYRKSWRRNAIYRFLNEVFEIATIWRADGELTARTRRAAAVTGLEFEGVVEPFRVLIAVAAQSQAIDDRTWSKWTRVLQFASEKKLPSTPLRKFVKRYGGINNCASEFTRRARRSSSKVPRVFADVG